MLYYNCTTSKTFPPQHKHSMLRGREETTNPANSETEDKRKKGRREGLATYTNSVLYSHIISLARPVLLNDLGDPKTNYA